MIDLIEYALKNRVSVSVIPISDYPLVYELRMYKEGLVCETALDASLHSPSDMDALITYSLDKMLFDLNIELKFREYREDLADPYEPDTNEPSQYPACLDDMYDYR